MLEYIILLLGSLLGFFIFDLKRNEGIIYFWFLFFLYVFVSGFRYKIGADTITYMENFDFMSSLTDLSSDDFKYSRYSPGWILFVAFSKEICSDFILIQILHSLFINYVIFAFIKKNTNWKFLGITFYLLFAYIYFNTEIIRESIAVCLFLCSYNYFEKNKWLSYYTLNIIAFSFHYSAIITLVFPIIKLFKFENKKKFLFFSIIFIVILVFLWRNSYDMINMFMIKESLSNNIKSYMTDDFQYNMIGILTNVIAKVLIPIFFIFLIYPKLTHKFYYPLILFIVIGTLVCYNSIIFSRFQNYFYFFFICLMVKSIEHKYRYTFLTRGIILLSCFISLFLQYYPYFRWNSDLFEYAYMRYYPYESYLY